MYVILFENTVRLYMNGWPTKREKKTTTISLPGIAAENEINANRL